MKKFISILLALMLTTIGSYAAMGFNDALSQSGKKPALILVNAKWASGYQAYLDNFRALQQNLGDAVNYVELDFADVKTSDAADFNKKYYVYTDVPYVIMLRNNGMVCRYIDHNCAGNYSCLSSKVNAFLKK